jgi:hypothetical protein
MLETRQLTPAKLRDLQRMVDAAERQTKGTTDERN